MATLRLPRRSRCGALSPKRSSVGSTCPLPAIAFSPPYPTPKRLDGVLPILQCDRHDRRKLRRQLRLVIEDQPNGSLPT